MSETAGTPEEYFGELREAILAEASDRRREAREQDRQGLGRTYDWYVVGTGGEAGTVPFRAERILLRPLPAAGDMDVLDDELDEWLLAPDEESSDDAVVDVRSGRRIDLVDALYLFFPADPSFRGEIPADILAREDLSKVQKEDYRRWRGIIAAGRRPDLPDAFSIVTTLHDHHYGPGEGPIPTERLDAELAVLLAASEAGVDLAELAELRVHKLDNLKAMLQHYRVASQAPRRQRAAGAESDAA